MDVYLSNRLQGVRESKWKSLVWVSALRVLVSALVGFSNLMVQFLFITMQPLIVSSLQFTVLRKVITATLSIPFLLLTTDIVATLKNRDASIPLILASIFNLGATLFAVYSLKILTLAEMLSITAISPFFCMLAGRAILREPIFLSDSVFSLISGTGVLITAQPKFFFGGTANYAVISTSDDFYWLGVLFAILTAIADSLAFVYGRLAYRKTTPVMFLFVEDVIGGVISILAMIICNEAFQLPQNFLGWIYMLNVGISIFLYNMAMHLGLSLGRAVILTCIRNLDIVFAFLLQYVVFNISMNFLSGCGAAIIIVTVLTQTIFRIYQQRHN